MRLDPLFTALPGPAETARWDRLASADYAMPPVLLMENAGAAAFRALEEALGPVAGLKALALAGGGNNGGDAFALARYLHNAGGCVRVLTLKKPELYQGPAAEHLRMARAAGVAIAPWRGPEDLADAPPLIIDALLGTGWSPPVRRELLELIEGINSRAGAFVYSLDLPSGLDALSGRPAPAAVRARLTVSFAAPKPGLILPWASEYVGRALTLPIGLPTDITQRLPPARRLITPLPGLIPKAPRHVHKGQKGQALIIGGSAGLSGAPLLSALAALRAGAGLVTLAVPRPCLRDFYRDYPEIMALPLEGEDWEEISRGPALRPLLERVSALPSSSSALVLGPGLGPGRGGAELLRAVLALKTRPPLLLDADGLRHCRAVPEPHAVSLDMLGPEDLITPHPGEMRRILGADSPPLRDPCAQEERELAMTLACAATSAVVLLKGPATLISRRKEALCLAAGAESNLAAAGSGDVLSGLIAALMARRLFPLSPDGNTLRAACLGAWLHLRAGRISAGRFPAGGALASELAEAIPSALAELAPEPC